MIRSRALGVVNEVIQQSGRKASRSFYLALGGVAFVVAVLLVPVGKPIHNPWGGGAWNLLHLPGFFLLTRSLLKLFGQLPGKWRIRPFVVGSLALAIGVATELLQGAIGRSASLDDLILDLVGITLAMIWTGDRYLWTRARRTCFALVLVGGLSFAFSPAIRLTWLRMKGRAQLSANGEVLPGATPLLWKGQGNARLTWERSPAALRVRIEPGGHYSGLNFLPGSQDWSDFSKLVLDLRNEGSPFVLGIRIDDQRSSKDRIWFSGTEEVDEGNSVVHVGLPRTSGAGTVREIDLSRIGRLVLFVEGNEFPVEFCVKSAVLR